MKDLPLPLVSVVIPCHQKSKTVKRTIDSIKEQTLNNLECFVVNDSSTDESKSIILDAIKGDRRFHYAEVNYRNVADTRNEGIRQSKGVYICALDADDWLEPTFLEVCVKELEAHQGLGITYTGLMTHNADGSSVVSEWPGAFNADKQLSYPKQNQIPTACVFRREAWQRVGGYRSMYAPYGAGSEDSALWSAICSIGYGAKKVTNEPLFNYTAYGGNVHGNQDYTEVDWLSMYPWASDGQHPFASVATPKKWSHPVRQYDLPAISVIIPVGPGHEKEVVNALDTLELQHFRKWEAIVVDDTNLSDGNHDFWYHLDKSYPYVRWVDTDGKQGAGVARNMGVKIARAPLILFLDADDVLADPHALDKMIDAWNANAGIIYSDYYGKAQWEYEAAKKEFGDRLMDYNSKTGMAVFKQMAADYDPGLACRQPEFNHNNPAMPYYHWCLVSMLIPKAWHQAIGGFDESMETWEDVDYAWRLARAGYCFYRINQPLIMYAYHKGNRREGGAVTDKASLQKHQNMIKYLLGKREYQEKPVGCSCGGRKQQTVVSSEAAAAATDDNQFVMVEFHYPGEEKRSSYGRSLTSPTRQRNPVTPNKMLEYKVYSSKPGDRLLVHIKDQRARPDMFRLVQAEVVLPEVEKVELPEPEFLV